MHGSDVGQVSPALSANWAGQAVSLQLLITPPLVRAATFLMSGA